MTPFGYLFSSNSARTLRPVSVVVAAISWTIVRYLRSGLLRQLIVPAQIESFRDAMSRDSFLGIPFNKFFSICGNYDSVIYGRALRFAAGETPTAPGSGSEWKCHQLRYIEIMPGNAQSWVTPYAPCVGQG